MREIDKLKREIKRLQNLITEIENTEQKPKIYSGLYKEHIRDRVIEKIYKDDKFRDFVDTLPDNLTGNLRLRLTYTENKTPDETIHEGKGTITRTIKADNERQDYKGRKKHNLTRDVYGDLYDDD